MHRRNFNSLLLGAAAAAALPLRTGADERGAYRAGDTVDPDVFVHDRDQTRVPLRALLAPEARVNVLFLFGGGALGSKAPGGLWCRDSHEDAHILRTLSDRYRKAPVAFLPIACPPVYHSEWLGFPKRAFLDYADDSEEFRRAARAFIDSTQAAYDSGLLPQQPYYDLRFRLLLDLAPTQRPAAAYGDIAAWHGRFRAPDEHQVYGVPAFWLLDAGGTVLAEPLRGNIYHPHEGELQIRYTLQDVDRVLAAGMERA